MSKAVCPGSFDPITLGHIDYIKKCAAAFELVYVVVGCNPSKKGMLSPDARVEYAREALNCFDNVEVVRYDGLVVDFACENECNVIVKGIRNAEDLDYENGMAFANSDIAKNKYGKTIETFYIPSEPKNMYISSSLVRQMIELDLPVDKYVHNSSLLLKLAGK